MFPTYSYVPVKVNMLDELIYQPDPELTYVNKVLDFELLLMSPIYIGNGVRIHFNSLAEKIIEEYDFAVLHCAFHHPLVVET